MWDKTWPFLIAPVALMMVAPLMLKFVKALCELWRFANAEMPDSVTIEQQWSQP
jgi:hypothetical protein